MKMIKNCNNFLKKKISKYSHNFRFTGSTDPLGPKVDLGSWERGEEYIEDIIEVCICHKINKFIF